jgi:hypothetical protein
MPANLYDIRIRGRHENLPHPHLVIAEHGGNCLCVPAFTEGGHELEQTLWALERLGVFRHQCSVDIDHAKHVTFFDGREPHKSMYVVAKRQILAKSFIAGLARAGEMNDAGLLKVSECVMEWQQNRPGDLPLNLVKQITTLRDKLLAALRS